MSRHILLIDDEDDIREIVALSLESVAGWQVSCAKSGIAGVEMAQNTSPDAILLDLMMPGQDGLATLRLLQSNAGTAKIPVVFLTAKAQRQANDSLRSIGAAGVLGKPFDPLTLADQLKRVLGW